MWQCAVMPTLPALDSCGGAPLVREAPRSSAPARPRRRRQGGPGLCCLRDSASADRAEIEGELAFFRKHRHRMRRHALKEEGIAIGSGSRRSRRQDARDATHEEPGMRCRIPGRRAALTFRALIKSGLFDRAWAALMVTQSETANDNITRLKTCRLLHDLNHHHAKLTPAGGAEHSPAPIKRTHLIRG